MIESDIDAYFAQFRRDAILLHRPYPPHDGPPTNSKFGGLPRLPADYAWPRDKNNAPLHFLAQIDCADIKVATPLPDRGVLFFFGRDDDEQIWDADNAPGRSTSVIYALDAFARTPLRDHPSDLGPIGGTYFRAKAWQNLLLKDEDGPRVHVEWPICRFGSTVGRTPCSTSLPTRTARSTGCRRCGIASSAGRSPVGKTSKNAMRPMPIATKFYAPLLLRAPRANPYCHGTQRRMAGTWLRGCSNAPIAVRKPSLTFGSKSSTRRERSSATSAAARPTPFMTNSNFPPL